MILHFLAVAGLLGVFGTIVFSRLLAAQYKTLSSLLLTVLCIVQPTYIYPDLGLGSILFTISIYATCAAGVAFAERQDPRRIMLLGGSLAGAQLVHPVCGAAASIALPITLRKSLAAENIRSTVGVVISVLFIPTLVVAGSFYLLLQTVSSLRLSVSTAVTAHVLLQPIGAAALGAIPLFAALKFRPVASGRIVGVLGIIATAGSVVSALTRGEAHVLEFSAVAGGLLISLVSDWLPDEKRVRSAVVAIAANDIVAACLWLVITGAKHG